MYDVKLNLLILGQTGVGKSSLINALVGHEVEKTGMGKPCTPEGIFPHEVSIDGKDVIIYDSWGLEVGKDKEWKEIIKNELKQRGVDKDIKDWFHSVTYCIQAGGAKIQDFDINIIKLFIDKQYDVVIALTKADLINEEKEKEFIEIIKKETGVKKVIPISASPQKLRGMTKDPSPLGLDDYQVAVLESWKDMFIERVPIYISEKIKNDLENKRYTLVNKYKKSKLNNNKLKNSITEDIEQFFKDEILLYVKDTIKAYYDVQIDIVSLNSGMLIHNGWENFNQYRFYRDNFFNIDFDNSFFVLLGLISFIPFIGTSLAAVALIVNMLGGKIKEVQREKLINELVDKLKYEITGKDYILNIKNTIIKCLDETDKRLSDDYIKFNILILGQTGVGKSSLINALVGHEVEKTGIGKPIAERGIFPHETSIDGKDVVIYDSFGLEVYKYEEWEEIIKNELKQRGIDKDIKDWFYNVTYCIQAGGLKIQDLDIKIIKQFVEEKYNVIVAITMVDMINEDKVEELKKIIKEETGVETVIALAAAPQKYRGMIEVPPSFGLYEYKEAVLRSWKKIFIDRVPLNIIKKLEKDIDKKAEELQYIKFDNEDLNDLQKLSEKITDNFLNFFNEKVRYYVLDSIKKYYKNSNIEYLNKDLNMIFDSNYTIDNLKMFSFAGRLHLVYVPPILVLQNLLKLSIFNIRKGVSVKKIIDELSYELKKQINAVGDTDNIFKNKLSNAINNILETIEEEQKNKS